MGLYSGLLAAALVLSAPWWMARMLTTGRYREGLRERLGRVPHRLRETVARKQVVWVHAVSVGEVLAASRLVKELGEALGDGWTIVVSTTTRTGQALARERFGADRAFYVPLDFRFAVRAFLRALRPALVLLVESELWPRVLHECGRAAVPVAVVNARMSDRSFRRARRVHGLWKRVLARVSLWLPQSQADAERLLALGVSGENITVTGNLKYDIRAPKQSHMAQLIRQGAAGRPVVVAGSTTEDAAGEWEEMYAIQSWERGPRQEHGALLVLAPRHPERFALVESLLLEFAYLKASDLGAAANGGLVFAKYMTREPLAKGHGPKASQGPHNFLPGHKGRIDIVLLDTIGDLAAVYGVADVAFVGGSLVRRGGHNPLEPAQFGVPVIIGPSFENFRDIVGKLQDANAICIVKGVDGLASAIVSLLNDPAAARQMGERGKGVFEEQGGATARSITALLPLLAYKGVTVRNGIRNSGHGEPA